MKATPGARMTAATAPITHANALSWSLVVAWPASAGVSRAAHRHLQASSTRGSAPRSARSSIMLGEEAEPHQALSGASRTIPWCFLG